MSKTVCVDLDATLAHYEGWRGEDHIGPPRPGARDFMAALRARGLRAVVFTTRVKADVPDRPPGETPDTLAVRVVAWLDANGIPHDGVYTGQGKPMAAAYVDDRAVAVPSNPGEGDFRAALRYIDDVLLK